MRRSRETSSPGCRAAKEVTTATVSVPRSNSFRSSATKRYRANLIAFLEEIIPVAEDAGVVMAIHPDDPPFSLFGLPRVVSTADDARALLNAVPSPANGLTMCAGSYGARGDNDLVAMIREFHDRIYFVHLRNIKREEDGSFYESDHLDGDNDIVGIVNALLDEEQQRQGLPPGRCTIPMRPDHGHTLGEEKSDRRGAAGLFVCRSYEGSGRIARRHSCACGHTQGSGPMSLATD